MGDPRAVGARQFTRVPVSWAGRAAGGRSRRRTHGQCAFCPATGVSACVVMIRETPPERLDAFTSLEGGQTTMSGWEEAPHLVMWEVTRACGLHCRHCRARAIPHREPGELTLRQIGTVLDDLARFSPRPTLIVTGGDPLEREDLAGIITAAVTRHFSVAMAPSVTPRLSAQVIAEWARLGVRAVSLSLDGPTSEIHDRYRGVVGTFAATLRMAQAVRDAGLHLQINTAVAPFTVEGLPAMAELVTRLGVSSWEVFFVIPTGRARPGEMVDAGDQERWLHWLGEYRATVPFRVTAVGAPQFKRVTEGAAALAPTAHPAVREAQGMMFINYRGEVYPSGYMPLSAGNVLDQGPYEIYRKSDLFRGLRDPNRLEGRCGTCAYRRVCGGSRARAYALTGNPWAEDPNCPVGSEVATA
jgi:radical SAM protein with 4Fe4S-binding SPASM domain